MTNGANSIPTSVIVVDRSKLLKSNTSAVSMPIVMLFLSILKVLGMVNSGLWLDIIVQLKIVLKNCLKNY